VYFIKFCNFQYEKHSHILRFNSSTSASNLKSGHIVLKTSNINLKNNVILRFFAKLSLVKVGQFLSTIFLCYTHKMLNKDDTYLCCSSNNKEE